ncbi:PilC/PilY family type IV pilus protein [Lysobacter humi (ex Lee et al. 2017)]
MNARSLTRRIAVPTTSALALCLTAALGTLAHAAASFPDYPLQTGVRGVAPNILFILDDSGSMEFDYMPDPLPAVGPTLNFAVKTVARNALAYNPQTKYEAWMQASGQRFTDGTSFTAAFSHPSLRANAIDLTNENMTFYMLKPNGNAAAEADYYRYRFKADNTIEKAYFSAGTPVTIQNSTGLARATNNNPRWLHYGPFNVTDIDRLRVTISGGNGDADLYVRKGATPDLTNFDCRPYANGNAESCTVLDAKGSYYVSIYAYASFTGVTLNVDTTSFWTPSATVPDASSRTAAEERANFATWYSYHRTRMKAAKAGASDAFDQLSDNYRVGYDSIWNRDGATSLNSTLPAYQIPVGNDGGLFRGTNRANWFKYLQAADGSNGTPLHGALTRAGEYYEKQTGTSGPWGPQDTAAQLTCRQSYAILTTDGYWNDKSGYTTALGNVDDKAGPLITSADGKKTYQYQPAVPFKDAYSDTLADIAMHYWSRDLRPDLANSVVETEKNPAFWQHMVTFGISIGLQGTLNPATAATSGGWPDPNDAEDSERIDDLLHSAVNGRGSFVAATNPSAFAQALRASLAEIKGKPASGSGAASNGPALEAGSRIFQATYTPGQWTGDVVSIDFGTGVLSGTSWSAAAKANLDRAAFASRKVLTWSGSAGTEFPTLTQKAQLERLTGGAPVSRDDNAAYIKGSNAREVANGGKLRDRASPIGDIVNSTPVYVATTGAGTLYVGANDGMLHGIDSATGAVRFSYVPAGINFSDLASLSHPEYVHRFFVDGGIDVTTSGGRKTLVASLGRGGKGVFALDVTDPAGLASGDGTKVLWDQTASVDTDIGYVLGAPVVLPDGSGGTLTFVGNGVESASGEAVLFVYSTTKVGNNWVVNTHKLKTGVTGGNGLAEPRVADTDGDGKADTVFAGDLKGNMWKFDVSGNLSSWSSKTPVKLFAAVGPDGKAQAITSAPALAREPGTRRLFVIFGTGRYISSDDISGTEASRVQSMYGLVADLGPIGARDTALQERTIVKVGKDSKGRNARTWESYATIGSKKGWFVDLDAPTAGERVVSRPLVIGRALWFASIIPSPGVGCESGGTGYLNALDAFTGTNPAKGANASGTYSFIDVNGNKKGDDKLDGESASGSAGYVTSVDVGVGMPGQLARGGGKIVSCGSQARCEALDPVPAPASSRRVGWREILGLD